MLLNQGFNADLTGVCTLMWHMHKKGSCWRHFNSCFIKSFPWETTNSHGITSLHLVVM